MDRVIALVQTAPVRLQRAGLARAVVVTGCALALIFAKTALPF
jgi:hypothetical protein